MAEDLDRKVAEALKIPIKTGGLCRADLEHLPKLFLVEEDGSLSLDKKGAFGRVEVVSRKWSPSTDAGDAIAALEEFCKARDAVPMWGYLPLVDKHYAGRIVAPPNRTMGVQAKTFCEWCCKAILSLESAP